MTSVLVRHVEAVAGSGGVQELLARAGDDRPLEEITSLSGWSTYAEACALFEAAREVTGDPAVGFRIGEEMLRQHAGTEVAALLRSLGSPGELLRNIAATGSKYSTVTVLAARHVEEWSATVTGEAAPRFPRHRLLCDYTAGVLSQVSALFGMEPAQVKEQECQVDGAPRCVYHVSWHPAASPDREREHLHAQLAALTERFEALQATASEMVSATDVDTLLTHVARRAGLAVRAPAHVLAVRLPDEAEVRVHAAGVPSRDLPALVQDILEQDRDGEGVNDRVVVEVKSARHNYGRLAALYPTGASFFDQERRLLAAYASQAAAALDTATALQEVSRRNDTARALLQLASELAEVTSEEQAAARIVAVVPRVVVCDSSAVFVWDRAARRLSMRASVGFPAHVVATLRSVSMSPADTPLLQGSLLGRKPFVLDTATPDPFLRALLDVTDHEAVAVMPMYAGEEFFGVVTAGVRKDTGRLAANQHVMELLGGVAAQGASALRNAQLLDAVTYRSLHDPLTGLPNRSLLRDRLGHALAQALRSGTMVGVLIVDLDHFKEINDAHGHAAGDEVIVVVGERLRMALRPGDTVARIGGDEFAVVLPDVTDVADCQTVAHKLLIELRSPIAFDGRSFAVSASIGAVAGRAQDSYDTLLKHADLAMYRAKHQGGSTIVVAVDR